jgi:PPOX class probable F420-dependent enzyme
MRTLEEFTAISSKEDGLAVVSTVRADGTVQASLVNAGVVKHPMGGAPTLAFVTFGAVKLANLRARSQVALTARSGWSWATVEGRATILGPDDENPQIDADRLRLLLREIFAAAGGTHSDWVEYDRVMAAERRAAVLIVPTRIYSS